MNPSDLTFRAAAPSDRPALEAIAARTWEGTDYLPRMIDSWLADPHGLFVVAQYGTQVIGTTKLTRHDPDAWWLEGMRVDPDWYGKGVAGALHRYVLAQIDARRTGGYVRLCTNVDNRAVRRMCEATGFSLRALYLRYLVSTDDRHTGAEHFRPLAPDDLPAVRDFLAASPYCEQADRSTCEMRWVCRFLTDARLEEYAAAQGAFVWQGLRSDPRLVDGLILGTPALPSPDWPPAFNVAYLDAMPGAFSLMASALRSWGMRQGFAHLRYMMPVTPAHQVAIEQAGWRRPEDGGGRACLYSRPLPPRLV